MCVAGHAVASQPAAEIHYRSFANDLNHLYDLILKSDYCNVHQGRNPPIEVRGKHGGIGSNHGSSSASHTNWKLLTLIGRLKDRFPVEFHHLRPSLHARIGLGPGVVDDSRSSTQRIDRGRPAPYNQLS